MGNGTGEGAAAMSGAQAIKASQRLLNGAYIHSVDPKGRIIIPQFFRDQIGARFVVGVNTAQDAIAVYPFDVWQGRIEMLERLVEKNRALERILARFSMLSYPDASFDQQGRVLIPALLRTKFLNQAQAVLVSGAYDYVRIVSEEQAAQEDASFLSENILSTISQAQHEG